MLSEKKHKKIRLLGGVVGT